MCQFPLTHSNFTCNCEGRGSSRKLSRWVQTHTVQGPFKGHVHFHPRAFSRRNLLNQWASASQKAKTSLLASGNRGWEPVYTLSKLPSFRQLQLEFSLIFKGPADKSTHCLQLQPWRFFSCFFSPSLPHSSWPFTLLWGYLPNKWSASKFFSQTLLLGEHYLGFKSLQRRALYLSVQKF